MWNIHQAAHFFVWLDVQPAKGHRVVMQTFPGGIYSGMDYYISSSGLMLTETTLDQTRFDPDGKVVTVLDACQICGPVGFYKSGNQIICKNCSAPINAQSVGQSGGCNPIPLTSSTNGEQITISQADLSREAPSSAK